jgi:hypothetical protein
MTEDQSASLPAPSSVFEKHLNRHGYAFQYSVIRRADELFRENKSPWVFEASEFPVEVQGSHARIDFVLSKRTDSVPEPVRYLVAECKRADPALGSWLFARAPYVRRGDTREELLVDSVWNSDNGLFARPQRLDRSSHIYHVAIEIKGNEKGHGQTSGRGAIEEAATQVLRGVNGLLECLADHPEELSTLYPVVFIPVIFTTARLWVTKTDLAAATLADGKVTVKPEDVTERPWLWLQYHASPGIGHEVRRYSPVDHPFGRSGVGRLLDVLYARAIAVVGPDGVDDFLTSFKYA